MLSVLLQNRAAIWSSFIVLLLVSIVGLTRLSVTPDNRVFYGERDPYFRQLASFEREFTPNTNFAFVLSCDSPIGKCDGLPQLIQRLSDQALDIDSVLKVDSLATYPVLSSTQDSITSKSFLERLCSPECHLDRVDDLATEHLVGRFVDEHFTTFAIVSTVDLDITDTKSVKRIYDQSKALLETVPDNIQARFVGTIPLMQAFVDATNREITGVMSIAVVLLFITLLGTLGSISLTLLMTFLGISTILITLGIAGWSGLVLNTATATIPLILFTLILATSMHFFMSIVRTKTDDPRTDSHRAVSVALGTQTIPILLTSATTTICMLSLMAVSSPPVQDIGIWTAIGVLVGTTALLLVCPTILVKISAIPRSRWQDFMQPVLNKYAREIERSDATSVATILLTLLAACSILFLEIDDDFVRYFEPTNEFRSDSEFVASKRFGSNNIEVVMMSGESNGIFDPLYLAGVKRLVKQIRSHPKVLNAYSIVDALDPIKTHFGNDLELTQLSKEQIAQLFLGYELSLEYGHSASELVNLDRSSSRISILAGDLSAAQIRRLKDFLHSITTDGDQFTIQVTGESIPISHLSPRNISAMVISIASTFAVSALMLAAYFRQRRIAIVALIATVVPVVCGFGLWGTLNDTIGLATTVIVAVCMGVVIDDAIHMIFQYRSAQLRLNLDKREASAYAVHRVGSAIVTTTVVLVVGFGVLLFSEFRLNSTFGGCSALILICALIFDLRILPELLVWTTSNGEPHNKNN